MEFVREEIARTIAVFQRFEQAPELIARVAQVGEVCSRALQAGHKILFAGNGGSAADAQHLAAEFVSRLTVDRVPLAAIALTTDTSVLTSAGNDFGFENIFSRQVLALGNPGDVMIGITTSGGSPNILRAMEAARAKGLVTVGLTGERLTPLAGLCDYFLQVPCGRTQNIQEVHIMIGHTICALAERAFLPAASPASQPESTPVSA